MEGLSSGRESVDTKHTEVLAQLEELIAEYVQDKGLSVVVAGKAVLQSSSLLDFFLWAVRRRVNAQGVPDIFTYVRRNTDALNEPWVQRQIQAWRLEGTPEAIASLKRLFAACVPEEAPLTVVRGVSALEGPRL